MQWQAGETNRSLYSLRVERAEEWTVSDDEVIC